MDRNNEEYPAAARPHGGRQGGRGRLARRCLLAVLVAVVILVQAVPGWGDVYARHVYPVVGELLSDVSGPVPFAVGDLFIALSLAGVVASDAHDPVLRTPELAEAADILAMDYGAEAAEVLLKKRPAEILKGE